MSLSQTLWSMAFMAFAASCTAIASPTIASPIMTSDPELPIAPSSSIAQIAPTAVSVDSYFENRLAVDTVRPLKVTGAWTMVSDSEWELRKREDESSSTEEIATSLVENAAITVAATTTSSSSDESLSSTTTSTNTSPLLSPMDENLNFNFTTNGGKSCPKYLNNLLSDLTFKECYPISMLLKGSSSFFTVQKELQSIVSVLDATCDVDFSKCSTYLRQEAIYLTNSSNCAEEYTNKASNVMMVYWGLVAYEPLYKATCVRDPETSMYCYALAVTNSTTTGNAYTYFMPLNSSFPDTAKPTCTSCLQETMSVFQTYTNDAGLPLVYNYAAAAKTINSVCGSGYVNETVRKVTTDSSSVVTVAAATSGGIGVGVSSVPVVSVLGGLVMWLSWM